MSEEDEIPSLEDLQKLRVVDLKKELVRLGLSQSGNKADLVQRIHDYYQEQAGGEGGQEEEEEGGEGEQEDEGEEETATPQDEEQVTPPAQIEQVPEVPEEPQVEEPAPQVEEPAPQVEEPAPQVEEPAPQVEEPAPEVEEPAPENVQQSVVPEAEDSMEPILEQVDEQEKESSEEPETAQIEATEQPEPSPPPAPAADTTVEEEQMPAQQQQKLSVQLGAFKSHPAGAPPPVEEDFGQQQGHLEEEQTEEQTEEQEEYGSAPVTEEKNEYGQSNDFQESAPPQTGGNDQYDPMDTDYQDNEADMEDYDQDDDGEEEQEETSKKSGKKSKKKKKKKKREGLEGMEDLKENLPDDDKDVDIDDDLDLDSFGDKKKKKKKKKPKDLEDLIGDDDKEEQKDENPWMESDRDYTYEELLQRVFSIMRDKNPDMVDGRGKKFVMRPPQVVRVGTKKTAFANFTEIAKMLHRQPKHLLAFLFAELGTSGAIDGNNQLIMKGRFQQKHIESVLRRYIKEYVTCHTCRSPDTILNKETRLFFLQCMTCHSSCSVQTIKTGFQAVTSKRAAIRAKQ
eukprot:TRINITY_DN11837_c0_g1_i2.p1 TRINITY_DN11837_c0_g1~~TRINITY_DN11837_c0_g1_i2.p1  ORF type:complete len:567 (-),score=235.25 TRINITY_DN11837_c0_g1_i2:92-1792(-)